MKDEGSWRIALYEHRHTCQCICQSLFSYLFVCSAKMNLLQSIKITQLYVERLRKNPFYHSQNLKRGLANKEFIDKVLGAIPFSCMWFCSHAPAISCRALHYRGTSHWFELSYWTTASCFAGCWNFDYLIQTTITRGITCSIISCCSQLWACSR